MITERYTSGNPGLGCSRKITQITQKVGKDRFQCFPCCIEYLTFYNSGLWYAELTARGRILSAAIAASAERAQSAKALYSLSPPDGDESDANEGESKAARLYASCSLLTIQPCVSSIPSVLYHVYQVFLEYCTMCIKYS